MFRTPVGEAGLQLCQMAWEGLSNEMGIVKSMHVEMEPRIIRMSRKVPAVVLGIKLEQNILDGTASVKKTHNPAKQISSEEATGYLQSIQFVVEPCGPGSSMPRSLQ
ncbi:hypothetical protein B0H14DRAFT_2559577 [Mycena olivaceomarginata]|nr:hypothetical protein B0H14DRAFT_2559577 [Mycena olivaceomarginata]